MDGLMFVSNLVGAPVHVYRAERVHAHVIAI